KNYHPNRKVSGELFIRGDARNLESAGTLIHDTTCFVQKRQSPPPGQPQAQSRSSQFPKRLPAAQGVPGSDRCQRYESTPKQKPAPKSCTTEPTFPNGSYPAPRCEQHRRDQSQPQSRRHTVRPQREWCMRCLPLGYL